MTRAKCDRTLNGYLSRNIYFCQRHAPLKSAVYLLRNRANNKFHQHVSENSVSHDENIIWTSLVGRPTKSYLED